MKKTFLMAALTALATLVAPAAASADSPICHNGVLSDDAGQGCVDGLYVASYSSGGSSSPICTDGILSNDQGQNCPDGLYERAYGSGATATTYNRTSGSGSVPAGPAVSSGGYAVPPASIKMCESGGNYSTNTGNGFSGAWQFTDATFHAVTGLSGHASDYSPAVQDAAAAKLYAGGAGAGNWPVCSRR